MKTEIIEAYKKGVDIPLLAELYGRNADSIRMILVHAGLYSGGYRTKTGSVPISRVAIVEMIEARLEAELPGLELASKSSLMKLYYLLSGETLE